MYNHIKSTHPEKFDTSSEMQEMSSDNENKENELPNQDLVKNIKKELEILEVFLV